jgi:HPt (histidine-containing phosphotransfer) domain-containing protein
LAVGMDDYLSKPVTYDKLDSVLSKWVGSELAKKLAGEKTMQEPGRETQEFGVPGAIPVDVQGLSELLGPEEAVEVLHLFVNSTEELIEQIRDASTRRDSKQLKEAAHQLKGAASSVGANTIARACLELEQCAKNDEWDLVPRLNDGLAQNFQNAKSYIQTLNS